MSHHKVSVLFVCMGNICRSPTAEGVFTHLVEQEGLADLIKIDSAGTHGYHVGALPDPRSMECALRRGIDLSNQRSRKVTYDDLIEFDYVLAMDKTNYQGLLVISSQEVRNKIKLFLDFATEHEESEVPDPYYGGERGFDHVFDLVEAASSGLLKDIREKHKI